MRHRIFLIACLSILVAIGLASFVVVPVFVVLALCAVAVALFFRFREVGFAFLIFALSIFWFSVYNELASGSIARFENQEKVSVEGQIINDPEVSGISQNFLVRVSGVTQAGKTETSSGKVSVRAPAFPPLAKNTRVKLDGKLFPLSETQRKSLFRENVTESMKFTVVTELGHAKVSWFSRAIDAIRNTIDQLTAKNFSEPEGSFLLGVLIGEKRGLPKAVTDAFNATGTTHIIAVSGFNVTILFTALAGALGKYFSKRTTFLLSCVSLIIFVCICGISASVVRAAIMGVLARFGKNEGRPIYALNLLFGAAAIMCVINPKTLIFDVGFQLSFLATAGIMFAAEYVQKYFAKWRVPTIFGIQETLAVTAAAQLLTTPLIVFVFHRFSVIALGVNLLALPLIPILMGTGALALTLNFALPFFAPIISIVPLLLLRLELGIIEIAARIPFASVEIPSVSLILLFVYCILVGMIFISAKQWKKKLCALESLS